MKIFRLFPLKKLFFRGFFFFAILSLIEISLTKETSIGLLKLENLQENIQKSLPRTQQSIIGINKDQLSFGSGVIVNADGLFFTAAHVMSDRKGIYNIILSDGRILKGKCLGYCEELDCAVGQIIEKGTYPFVLMAQEEPTPGMWVYALGHPYEFNPARGSVLRLGKIIDRKPKLYQTDCKVVSGDSGGGLFTPKGELLGIHSRIGQSTEDNVHIPFSLYKNNLEKLKQPKPFTEKDLLTPQK